MLHRFKDIHTHVPGQPNSILSVPVSDVEQIVRANEGLPICQQQYYSLQLHPWHLSNPADISCFVEKARQLKSDPHFLAIGECGLDSLCQTPLPLQRQAFIAALQVASELQKPVIIHCVRLWAEMMEDVAQILGKEPSTEPIIHGFRKGPTLAQQLLNAGFSISLGHKSHPDVEKIIPHDRLYHESDAEPMP